MEITTRDEDGAKVLLLSGKLDASNSSDLVNVFEPLLKDGHRKFIIDLQEITFIDSAGLSALVKLYKKTRGQSARLWLAAPQDQVRRVFQLTRLDRAFDIAETVPQALQSLIKP